MSEPGPSERRTVESLGRIFRVFLVKTDKQLFGAFWEEHGSERQRIGLFLNYCRVKTEACYFSSRRGGLGLFLRTRPRVRPSLRRTQPHPRRKTSPLSYTMNMKSSNVQRASSNAEQKERAALGPRRLHAGTLSFALAETRSSQQKTV